MAETTLLDTIEKLAKIAAIGGGGAWVYFNTIRGRTFIPRLQTEVSGKVLRQGGAQYLLVNMQVKNVGSSIAWIKEEGTGLKISPKNGFRGTGALIQHLHTDKEKETAFPVFGLVQKETRAMEPGTIIYSQEVVEVPVDQYDAFEIELRVSALGGWWRFFSKKNRKWRSFATVLDDKAAEAEKQERG